jgi:hypothetical protein
MNNDDPSDPIPKQVDDMVNRRIPEPVYPSPNPIIYIPGSDKFWNGVAFYSGVGAGAIATGGLLGGLLGGGAAAWGMSFAF